MNSTSADTRNLPRTRRKPGMNQLSRPAAFIAITAIFVTFTAASSAPSPLYIVYQENWGFSAITLTVVFAVYVVGLLGSLLVVGALSDHIGRRPVLFGAIGLEAFALVLFILAPNVIVLGAARVFQGIATGAAMTTLSAALVDLNPKHAPTRAGVVNSVAPVGGLAAGALGTGALVQFGPAPTHLVYALLLGGMALAFALAIRLPETSARRPGARESLKPKVSIPVHLRPDVFALVPIFIASWALGGLYLSLGPSVAAQIFGQESHLIGGLVVTLLAGSGAVTALVLRNWDINRALNFSGLLLATGMVITLAGVEGDTAILAAAGTIIAGIGFGAAALGTFGTLGRIAAPDERGELFAVAFVIAYVSFSLPAVIAGLASSSVGLHDTAVAYGVGVFVLSLAALAAQRTLEVRRRGAAPDAEPLPS